MLDQFHQASLQSIAFQLAVCYHTGFGVRRDVEKSQVLLTQSRRNYRGLHNAVETAQQETEPQKTRHSNFNTYSRQGSIIIYPAQYYSSYRHQKHAEMEYIREIADMASVFGNNQNVVVKLKSALTYIYYGQGSYDKSKELWMQCAEFRSITVGQEHPQTLHYRS